MIKRIILTMAITFIILLILDVILYFCFFPIIYIETLIIAIICGTLSAGSVAYLSGIEKI